jgi:hypothetical protein
MTMQPPDPIDPTAVPPPVPPPSDAPPPAPPPVPPADFTRSAAPPVVSASAEPSSRARLSVGVQAGGGVVGFSSAQMRQLARPGGYWDARLVLDPKKVFGAELAYLGAVQPVDGAGGASATLLGNGAEGDLRVNIPVHTRGDIIVAPYALAGMGWMHYGLTGGSPDGLSLLASRDDILVFPVGAGLTVGRGHLYLDARFTYRFTALEDMAPGGGQLRTWNAGANVGVLF